MLSFVIWRSAASSACACRLASSSSRIRRAPAESPAVAAARVCLLMQSMPCGAYYHAGRDLTSRELPVGLRMATAQPQHRQHLVPSGCGAVDKGFSCL